MSHDRHIARSRFVYGPPETELWDDVDQFYKDHLMELNAKLSSLDDNIWAKAVLMERNRRIAKAYLRQSRFVVDGSRHEFDGKLLGWNSFSNSHRDAQCEELRTKIGEGVAVTMDSRGSVWALARGTSPVFVQGWKDTDRHCFGDRVHQQQGRLPNHDPFKPNVEDDKRAVKIFDMTTFKRSIEQELSSQNNSSSGSRKKLLFKTCVRIALVKDGHFPTRTPCWFLLINLVALDMLNSQLPIAGLLKSVSSRCQESNELTIALPSQTTDVRTPVNLVPPTVSPSQPPPNADSQTAAALSQILAATAAITQQQQQSNAAAAAAAAWSPTNQLAMQLAHNLAFNPFAVPQPPPTAMPAHLRYLHDGSPSPPQQPHRTARGRTRSLAAGYLSEADSIMSIGENAHHQRRLKPAAHHRHHGRFQITPTMRQANQSMDCLYEQIDTDADDEFQTEDKDSSRKPKATNNTKNFSLARQNNDVYAPINAFTKLSSYPGMRNGSKVGVPQKWGRVGDDTSDCDDSSSAAPVKTPVGITDSYDSSNYSTASRSSAASSSNAHHSATRLAACSSPSFLSDVNSEFTTTTADSGFNDDSTMRTKGSVSGDRVLAARLAMEAAERKHASGAGGGYSSPYSRSNSSSTVDELVTTTSTKKKEAMKSRRPHSRSPTRRAPVAAAVPPPPPVLLQPSLKKHRQMLRSFQSGLEHRIVNGANRSMIEIS